MTLNKSDIKLNRELANKAWAGYNKIVYEPFVDAIADVVAKYNIKKIAEVGCGHGKTGYYLKKVYKYPNLTIKATEISEVAKEKSEHFYDEIQIRTDYKLPNDKFELVLLTSVIEHIYDENLEILFQDINNKLCENGKVFVVVPNIHSPVFLLTDSKDKQKKRMGHVNLKSQLEWNRFFKKYGFKKIKYSFTCALPNIKKMAFFKSKVANRVLELTYRLLNVFPFYYLKNSYWILLEK